MKDTDKIVFSVFLIGAIIVPTIMAFMATNEPDVIKIDARTPEDGNWSITYLKVPADTEGIVLKVTAVDVVHSLEIPSFNISVELIPGEPVYVELPPIPAGRYSYFCHVPCSDNHLQMKGILEAL